MNSCLKYFHAGLLALLTQAAFAQSAPSLGAASEFAVLGGTAVTCTTSVVAGDVGISPGITAAFTNTGCTISGDMPPATNADAVQARAAMLSAYAALQARTCTQTLTGTLAGQNLAPGVYCVTAEAKTGLLTLTGPSNGVWIFLVAGALTGTNFSVAMAGGGKPCNVFWAPSAAATMTTSALKGNILTGNPIGGSITLTGGSLVGRALANVAVTMTNASVIDCDVVADDSPICKPKKHHGHHGHDHDKGHGHSPFDKHDGKDDKHDKHDGKDGKDDKDDKKHN
jgi:hypothetical protein